MSHVRRGKRLDVEFSKRSMSIWMWIFISHPTLSTKVESVQRRQGKEDQGEAQREQEEHRDSGLRWVKGRKLQAHVFGNHISPGKSIKRRITFTPSMTAKENKYRHLCRTHHFNKLFDFLLNICANLLWLL